MSDLTAMFSAPFIGGSEVFNLEFLRDAHARGTRVTAIVPGEGALADAVREFADQVIVIPIPPELGGLSRFGTPTRSDQVKAGLALASYGLRLRRALRRSPGLLCALGFRAQLAIAVTGAARGRELAWIVHEVVPDGRFGRIWGRASRRAQSVLSFSQTAASQPLLAGAAVRLFDARLDLTPMLALDAPSRVRTLGIIGDLFPLKNHLGFLEVLDQLHAKGHAVQGLIVGRDTSASNPTADYVRELTAAVHAHGDAVARVESSPGEMPAQMARIDVLLHLSTEPESFGRVVVEAMAAARPVVAFDRGAIPELIENGTDGYLVSPDDLAAVADAVELLLADDDAYTIMSRAARQTAQRRWDATLPGETVGAALADLASRT